jgi:DNA-binding response OmpR family regulator
MPLSGRRILVAEDLYLVALMTCEAIQQCGAHVIGPFPSSADCLAALDVERVDAAILNIGLTDGFVYPVARRLQRGGIPFVFLSGYDSDVIPPEFATAPYLVKPCNVDLLCTTLVSLLEAAHPSHSGASGGPSPATRSAS